MAIDLPLLLFAAGFGTRMRPLTETTPKPLIKVAGKALIDHALDLADDAGMARRVVNLHYLGDQIEAYLQGRGVGFAWEPGQILDTGGGLKAALPLLGAGPVMTLNTDAVWSGANPLVQLAQAWDSARMDVLFLLLPAGQAISETGRSDFVLGGDGRVEWAAGRDGCLYLGAQVINPDLLADMQGAFSLRAPWQNAIEAGRAFGVIHHGGWCDVGHVAGIAQAENFLRAAND